MSDLRFADDVALTTDSMYYVEHDLNFVNEESLKIALKIHKGKVEFITNIDTKDNIQIDGIKIDKVSN